MWAAFQKSGKHRDFIHPTHRLKLTIADAETSDSGQYTCEATRDGKTASSTFVVDVHAPILEALVEGDF